LRIAHFAWDGAFNRDGAFCMGLCILHGVAHFAWDGALGVRILKITSLKHPKCHLPHKMPNAQRAMPNAQ